MDFSDDVELENTPKINSKDFMETFDAFDFEDTESEKELVEEEMLTEKKKLSQGEVEADY